jgi:hypothetical protein
LQQVQWNSCQALPAQALRDAAHARNRSRGYERALGGVKATGHFPKAISG